MIADEPPQVPICPTAYEVFASAEEIQELAIIVDRNDWDRSETVIEVGDVGRFTLFAPKDPNSVFTLMTGDSPPPPELVDRGTHIVPSLTRPVGRDCKSSQSQQIIRSVQPDIAYVEIDDEFADQFASDLDGLEVGHIDYHTPEGDAVFKLVGTNIMQDYMVQSVSYRILRGDYGDIVIAYGITDAAIAEMKALKKGQAND